MSDNRVVFIELKEIPKGTWLVAIANEYSLWVLGKGDIKVKKKAHDQWLDGTLHDVLYILDLKNNLFSIGRATNKGVITIYKKNTCQMIGDNGNGDIILTGIQTKRCSYKLQMNAIVMDEVASCTYQV